MILFLFIIHLAALLILARLLLYAVKTYKIPVNMYNIPIAIFVLVGLIGSIYVTLTHAAWAIIPAIIISIVMWFVNSARTPEGESVAFSGKVMLSLVTLVIWPEVIVFAIFFLSNYSKIIEYEKSEY